MASPKVLYTAEDLEQLERATGKRYELVRGHLVELAVPNWRHSAVALRFGRLVDAWNDEVQAGIVGVEPGCRLERDPDTVPLLDLAYTAKGRMTREQARQGYPDLAPDFVAEIRSPGNTWRELEEKAAHYLALGVRLVVLVEPDQFIQVHRPGVAPVKLGLDDVFTAEEVLPGFSCRVRDLFPEEFY